MTLPSLAMVDGQAGADPRDPAMSQSVLQDLQQGLDELLVHRRPYVRARRYYEGNVPEVFASPQLRRAMRQAGVDFDFNFAKTPVDAIADRLEIASVTGGSDEATSALDQLRKDNELDLEAPDLHRRAGQYGDAYMIVWPLESPDPDDESAEDSSVKVGIHYNSPERCRIFYDEENPRLARYAIKRWQLPGVSKKIDPVSAQTAHPPVRVDLLYADRIERYITKKGKDGWQARDFVRHNPDQDEDGWRVDNPYGRVPVFHFRNGRPYGCPDHRGFYGPQNAITKLVIGHIAGVDYQSFPQRYALLAAEADSSDAAALDEDEFALDLDDEQSASRDVRGEADSTYSASPGSLWLMRGVQGVGQFQTADPRTFLDPMVTYIKCGAQITRTPLHYFDVAGQVPSGESLRAAEGPHNKTVRNRQLSYGGTWQDLFEFALQIMGIESAEVVVNWSPPATIDDSTGWQTITTKLNAGVPPAQAFLEAGYTEEQVSQWAPGVGLDQLAKVAGILVQLGTAVSLQVIDQSTVQHLVRTLMPIGHDPGEEEADALGRTPIPSRAPTPAPAPSVRPRGQEGAGRGHPSRGDIPPV